jgi:hypothetical protein
VNNIDQNATEFLGRIQSLERRLQTALDVQKEQGTALQTVVESQSEQVEYGHQNHIRNGDLHFTRNNYLYDVDFAGGTGEDGNVSLEAAHIYSHPADTAVDTTGSITSGTAALAITTPSFIAGDAGVEIVVYGAGVAGANLVTTISGAPGSATTCTLLTNASTTVTNARVRFRLLQLKEDSTDVNADASLATNTTLKTSTHTRYATTVNNPDYDKANGWVRWSDASNTLTFPLAFNTLTPSKQYILTFIYKLANPVAGEDEVFVDFYGGLWDNSAGRRQFLEGTKPTLTGSQQGTTGATTREYMVLMYMSDGSTVGTETLTLTDTNATIDSTNYVELTWDQEPGVVRSEIYRNTGGTYVRLLPPYPANTYYDRGQISNTVVGFPTATRERFIAKTKVTEGNFAPARQTWQLGQMNIVVPSTYDASGTTDKQWLVIGMDTDITGTDSERALLVDLISLDDKFGVFTRCPLDFLAKRGVNTGPSGGDQGTTGGGGGPIPPGGGGGCTVFTDLIETDKGPVPAIDLVDNEHNYQIINRLGDPVSYEAMIIPPQTVYTLIAGDSQLTASETHPVFEGYLDNVGKPLYRFREHDIIYTSTGDRKVDCLVKHFKKRHTIKFSLKGPEKGFWQNGIAVHNEKNEF